MKDIQTFNLLYPQEKVYLHFDNTGYFLGETIWFKAYVTVASTLAQTPLSRVLYVELINEEGYIMESRKFKIENGQAHGDIPLTKMGLKSGFFEVRAYTRLMLNWDKEVLFSRVFPVFEAPAKEGVYSKKQIRRRSTDQHIPVKREVFRPDYGTKKVNVSYYPEGGTLVEGLPSVVAFKATDSEGRSLEVEGEVRNTEGDILAFFSTHHQGMGSFEYTPRAGESNKVYIISEDKEYEFSLPKVSLSGVVLSVNALQTKHREPVGVRKTHLMGFSSPREFYSPNYKEYALPDESDYRRTLYWNPNVKTDSGGKASVSFYNNNSCEEMNVSAETITPDGIPGGYYRE